MPHLLPSGRLPWDPDSPWCLLTCFCSYLFHVCGHNWVGGTHIHASVLHEAFTWGTDLAKGISEQCRRHEVSLLELRKGVHIMYWQWVRQPLFLSPGCMASWDFREPPCYKECRVCSEDLLLPWHYAEWSRASSSCYPLPLLNQAHLNPKWR